jgi:hypothetical protein
MSDFGFGSEIVDELLYTELSGLSAVTTAVGPNVLGRSAVIQGDTLPAVLFYTESSQYDPPAFGGDNIGLEQLRYVVRFISRSASTDPIRAAALAQRQHFNGTAFDVTSDGHTYLVSFDAQGAFPMTTVVDAGTIYRQLGTIYSVTVTLGG